MRSLTVTDVNNILKESNEILPEAFIETGTYMGATTILMADLFNTVHTIEINAKFYKLAKKNALKKNINNIQFYLGDSAVMMNNVIKSLGESQSGFFFLDGHITLNGKADRKDHVVNDAKDVPLLEELRSIYKNYKGSGIIVIDDARLFGVGKSKVTAGADWSDIDLEKIAKSFPDDRVKQRFFTVGGGSGSGTRDDNDNDRYVIVFNAKKN